MMNEVWSFGKKSICDCVINNYVILQRHNEGDRFICYIILILTFSGFFGKLTL